MFSGRVFSEENSGRGKQREELWVKFDSPADPETEIVNDDKGSSITPFVELDIVVEVEGDKPDEKDKDKDVSESNDNGCSRRDDEED